MNHDLAPAAWRYAGCRPTPYISYVWDLPPFRLGSGRSDHVVSINRHVLSLPRIGRRYQTRRGYYSRLEFVSRRAIAVWTPSATTAADVGRRFSIAAIPIQYCYNSHLFTGEDRARDSRPFSRGGGLPSVSSRSPGSRLPRTRKR